METNLAFNLEEKDEEAIVIKLQEFKEEKHKNIDFSLYKISAKLTVNLIYDEINRFWKNKHVIQSAILDINKYNVFDFVRTMHLMSETNEIFREIRKYVTVTDVVQIVEALLHCARDLGYEELPQYKYLKRDYLILISVKSKNKKAKIPDKVLKLVDNRVIRLYKELVNMQNN